MADMWKEPHIYKNCAADMRLWCTVAHTHSLIGTCWRVTPWADTYNADVDLNLNSRGLWCPCCLLCIISRVIWMCAIPFQSVECNNRGLFFGTLLLDAIWCRTKDLLGDASGNHGREACAVTYFPSLRHSCAKRSNKNISSTRILISKLIFKFRLLFSLCLKINRRNI